MGRGRPCILDEAMIQKTKDFVAGEWRTATDGIAAYPGVMGLSLYLEIDISTVEDWEQHPEKSDLHRQFSGIVKQLKGLKKFFLVQLGVKGELNPKICAMLLSRVGVVEVKPPETTVNYIAKGDLPPGLQEVIDSVNTEPESKD